MVRRLIKGYLNDEVGHDWPSAESNSDNDGNVASYDATPILLTFFAKLRLP